MKGFFNISSVAKKKPCTGIPHCGACGLSKEAINPRMKPTGQGKKKILIVAEAPDKKEDIKGTHFIGEAGLLLRKHLDTLDIDIDRDCWKTNAVICKPQKHQTPNSTQIGACRPNLIKTIKKLDPNIIILLGSVAVESLIGGLWESDCGSIGRWNGYTIPCTSPNVWIAPIYHPSYIIKNNNDSLLELLFQKHLKKAISLSANKPWNNPPDYKKKIEIIARPSEAAKIIKEECKKSSYAAFDYETTCLKPEYKGAEIVSCSICFDGNRTIAYPFENESKEATIDFIRQPIYKIASNLKFEDRWTKRILGTNVKNWYWDTMIAAHTIDNKPEVTSIKFQSFVLIGAPSYNTHIKPYLSSKNKEHLNRIKELSISDLLLYNGLDSLLEYKVAMKQIKLLERVKNG